MATPTYEELLAEWQARQSRGVQAIQQPNLGGGARFYANAPSRAQALYGMLDPSQLVSALAGIQGASGLGQFSSINQLQGEQAANQDVFLQQFGSNALGQAMGTQGIQFGTPQYTQAIDQARQAAIAQLRPDADQQVGIGSDGVAYTFRQRTTPGGGTQSYSGGAPNSYQREQANAARAAANPEWYS